MNTPSSKNARLKANSFGWSGQFFQSMAHMAPAIGVVLNAQVMASRAGSALPLASLFAMILALLLAYCLGLLTRKYYGASGYFQIHSRALGSKVGFVTSWLFLLYEPFNAFLNFFGFGILIFEPFSKAYWGFTIPWWIVVIVGNLIITFFSLAHIKSSMRTAAILGMVEFIVFLVLGALLILKSDHPFQPQSFALSSSADGIGGLLFAFIFGFMAFVGYESGLPLTEETKDTTNATFKGLLTSVGLAGLFYVFLSYATVVGFSGGDNSKQFGQDFSNAANPYGSTLALKVFGAVGPWLILFAAINSTLGCCLAGQNASARVLYALGRAKILPQLLGQIHKKNHIPSNAIFLSSGFTFLVTFLFYFLAQKGNPLDWYYFLGMMLVLPLLIIHLMTCVSVFITYRHKEKGDFKLLHHGLIPLVTGLLALLPIWGAIYYNQTPPISYVPWVVLIWFLIGIGVYSWLKRRNPKGLSQLESEMDLLTQP